MSKLTINAKSLLHITAFAGQVVSDKPTSDVIGDVIYNVYNDRIYARGTDLNTTLVMSEQWKTSNVGNLPFTLPPKKLIALLATIPDDEDVTIGVDTLTFKHKISWRFKESVGSQQLIGQDPLLFPLRTKVTDANPLLFTPSEAASFADTFKQIAYVCEGERALNSIYKGVNLSCDTNGFVFSLDVAALDGYTLAFNYLVLDIEPSADFNIIVPRTFSKFLSSACKSNEGPHSLRIDKSAKNIQASIGNAIVCTSLIDEKYPPYQQIIPAYESYFTLPKTSLLDSIKRCLSTSSTLLKNVIFFINKEGPGKVSIYSQNLELGTFTDECISVDTLHVVGNLRLCFNGEILRDAVNNTIGNILTVRFGTSDRGNTSFLISGDGSETQTLCMGIDESKLSGDKTLIGKKL